MAKTAIVEGTEVKVGDWVGFKCDIEQSGEIFKIHVTEHGTTMLYLTNPDGFEGEYIGGRTKTIKKAEDCYLG